MLTYLLPQVVTHSLLTAKLSADVTSSLPLSSFLWVDTVSMCGISEQYIYPVALLL